ncbi:hypothetical protein ACTHOQ_06515 [Solibacillus silvestris]|uniref:hypothetical protein n=1 Tax=Solibacillus silvestris TaxID=76853 RepID=UPI003F7CDFCC
MYQFSFVYTLSDEHVNGMVIGSLIDCAIVAPALLLVQKRKWSVRNFVVFVAAGILFARLVIPSAFIEPFRYLTFSVIENENMHQFKVWGNTEDQPAFVIEMKYEQTIHLIGGIEKKAKYIGIYADDPVTLRREIELAMESGIV